MTELTRARYAELFGPTTGDRIRLADTDLLIEITEDRSGDQALPVRKLCSVAEKCCGSRWGRAVRRGPTAPPTP